MFPLNLDVQFNKILIYIFIYVNLFTKIFFIFFPYYKCYLKIMKKKDTRWWDLRASRSKNSVILLLNFFFFFVLQIERRFFDLLIISQTNIPYTYAKELFNFKPLLIFIIIFVFISLLYYNLTTQSRTLKHKRTYFKKIIYFIYNFFLFKKLLFIQSYRPCFNISYFSLNMLNF